MNKQHIILYQKNVMHPKYISTILFNDQDIILYIVKNNEALKERLKLYQIDCILYECDFLTKENIIDINMLEKLSIPYLLVVEKIAENINIDKQKVIFKPQEFSLHNVYTNQLIVRIKSLYPQKRVQPKSVGTISQNVIGIGASTGGPHAILEILKQLPNTMPGIVIVQHMTDSNTISFVQYLESHCDLKVKVAIEDEVIKDGVVYVAKQKQHLIIQKEIQGYSLHYQNGEKVNCVCPSIDVFFDSMAQQVGEKAIGILLTGMGSDGASGLKKLKEKGALTIIQDKESSEMESMPQEAKRLKAHCRELSLSTISGYLIQYFHKERSSENNGNK